MKEKTFHALLLSVIVVAGAMTINDAFAQTNTDRLITVADTTADTNTMVSGLVDLWSNFDSNFTPILSVIDALSDELSTVSDELSTVSDDVTAVDSKIAAFESKFDEFATTDAANAVEAQTNYDNFAQMLPEIQNTVDLLVDDADTSFDTISEKLDALQAQIGQFTSSISTLQSDVVEIQDELGIVQTSVQNRIGLPPTDLHDGEETESILLSWYARGVSTIPTGGTNGAEGEYTADFMFVCESDVFVDDVSTDLSAQDGVTLNYKLKSGADATKQIDINPIFDTTAHGTEPPYQTELTAGDKTLFNSRFNASDTSVNIVYDRDVELNLMELKAGSHIQFESSVVDLNTNTGTPTYGLLEYIVRIDKNSDTSIYFDGSDGDIDGYPNLNSTDGANVHNATKAELAGIEAYTVTVKYFSADKDPECKILPSTTTDADKSGVTFVNAKPDEDSRGLLQSYSETLDCDLNPTTITGITAELTGADGLNSHVTMELKVQGDDDPKAEFTFVDNVSVIADESSLPFEFYGANLLINGDIIDDASILIEVEYETVETNGCSHD